MPALLSDITQGHRIASQRAGDAAIVHQVTYSPGAAMLPHAHARANITLILAGAVHEDTEDHAYDAGAIRLVIKPSTAQHATRISPRGLRAMVIELSPDTERSLRNQVDWFDHCACVDSGPILEASLALLSALSTSSPHPARAVNEWLARLAAAPGPRSPVTSPALDAAMGAIALHYSAPLDAGQLAVLLRIHPVSVSRLFTRSLGCGVMTHLRRVRVSEAADRLARTRAPIARIAAEVGFADQAHLTRSFRRETGLTPAHFRRLTGAWN